MEIGRDGPGGTKEIEPKTRRKPQPALSLPQKGSLVKWLPSLPRRQTEMFTFSWFHLEENGAGLWRTKPRGGPYGSQNWSET